MKAIQCGSGQAGVYQPCSPTFIVTYSLFRFRYHQNLRVYISEKMPVWKKKKKKKKQETRKIQIKLKSKWRMLATVAAHEHFNSFSKNSLEYMLAQTLSLPVGLMTNQPNLLKLRAPKCIAAQEVWATTSASPHLLLHSPPWGRQDVAFLQGVRSSS